MDTKPQNEGQDNEAQKIRYATKIVVETRATTITKSYHVIKSPKGYRCIEKYSEKKKEFPSDACIM